MASKLYLPEMLLSRDYTGYMVKEVIKRLFEAEMIESSAPDVTLQTVRTAMADELGVEDRLNEEVREILNKYSDEMRDKGISYQDMYKKVKGELARQRRLILR
jgi:hypothetical protein